MPGIGYTLIDTCAGSGINGGIGTSPDGAASVTFYIETDDMQAALDKVNLLGGKTETPITELAGMVTFAKFCDPDGLRHRPGPRAGRSGAGHAAGPGGGAPVDWFEVLGADADRSQRFYAEIFGWQASAAGPGYAMVDTGTEPRHQRRARRRRRPGQLGDRVRQRARCRGRAGQGRRARRDAGVRPNPVDDHMQTGALRDPAGNVFGVYHHAPH